MLIKYQKKFCIVRLTFRCKNLISYGSFSGPTSCGPTQKTMFKVTAHYWFKYHTNKKVCYLTCKQKQLSHTISIKITAAFILGPAFCGHFTFKLPKSLLVGVQCFNRNLTFHRKSADLNDLSLKLMKYMYLMSASSHFCVKVWDQASPETQALHLQR